MAIGAGVDDVLRILVDVGVRLVLDLGLRSLGVLGPTRPALAIERVVVREAVLAGGVGVVLAVVADGVRGVRVLALAGQRLGAGPLGAVVAVPIDLAVLAGPEDVVVAVPLVGVDLVVAGGVVLVDRLPGRPLAAVVVLGVDGAVGGGAVDVEVVAVDVDVRGVLELVFAGDVAPAGPIGAVVGVQVVLAVDAVVDDVLGLTVGGAGRLPLVVGRLVFPGVVVAPLGTVVGDVGALAVLAGAVGVGRVLVLDLVRSSRVFVLFVAAALDLATFLEGAIGREGAEDAAECNCCAQRESNQRRAGRCDSRPPNWYSSEPSPAIFR